MLDKLTTRDVLAYFWSLVCAFLIYYILRNWGQEKEILTLIIGLIGGTIIGGIFGVYFGASHKSPLSDQRTTTEVNIDGSATVTTEPAVVEPKAKEDVKD